MESKKKNRLNACTHYEDLCVGYIISKCMASSNAPSREFIWLLKKKNQKKEENCQ